MKMNLVTKIFLGLVSVNALTLRHDQRYESLVEEETVSPPTTQLEIETLESDVQDLVALSEGMEETAANTLVATKA
jgi:hypothetical protein